MAQAKGAAAFVDTSIQIARLIHSPETRNQIDARLSEFDLIVSGLVVEQEFKRRLLKDARYLLDLFSKYGSFEKVQRHVVDVLTPFQKRKQKISLQLLTTLLEDDTDADRTDRAILLLEGLIRDGLYEFEQSVDHVIQATQCSCALKQISKVRDRYEFGSDKCSAQSDCGILSFLEENQGKLAEILSYLNGLKATELTPELESACEFIRKFIDCPTDVQSLDPCKTVGDLLIALESLSVPVFYTLNGKESQHLCKVLGQTLIVKPTNPANEEVVCDSSNESWPRF